MLENLASTINAQLQEKIETLIMAERGVSLEEAKSIVGNLSFSEYMKLREASVDMNTSHVDTTPGAEQGDQEANKAATAPDPNSPFDPVTGNFNPAKAKTGATAYTTTAAGNEAGVTIKRRIGNEFEVETDDGQRFKVPVDKMMGPGQLKDKSIVNKTASFLSKAKNATMRGVNHGKQFASKQKVSMKNSADHDELRRIQELAGIEETASAGSTGAGAIASTPSVVGNTAHRPTDRLRAKLRREKEKKKK
jgi:hypothetical protein